MTDADYMARALFHASRGRGRTSPNPVVGAVIVSPEGVVVDRKSTRLNFSHQIISYAVFCLKKKNTDLAALLPIALKFLKKDLLSRMIVCEDDDLGAVGNTHTPIPDHSVIVMFKNFVAVATR